MKYNRQDYMEKRCTHREYYAQFVTEGIRHAVLIRIGLDKLLRSEDPHFNDIPIREWDSIHCRYDALATRFVAEGDNSLSTGTCIVKEAARQIVEQQTAGAKA